MGDRASYAIREGGKIELFYGQFGAGAFLADIFWGPDTCEAMIREHPISDEWLDDVFGEAAIAMCKDTRKVAFYDSRYSRDTQQLAAKLMRELWPGWRVGAVHFVSGVAAAIGVDLRDRERPTAHFVSDLQELGHACHRGFVRAGLVEVVRGGQRDRRMIGGELKRHLWHGPRLIDAMPFLAPIGDVRAGLATRFDRYGEKLPLLDRGAGIATIDVDKRTLDVTYLHASSATGSYAFTGAAAERWPGWTVRRFIGTAAEHYARLGLKADPDLEIAPPERPLVDQVRELAHGLFATEANKEQASEWLEGVLGWGGNLVNHPLSADDRLQTFRKVIATLDLHDIARGDALRRAREGADPQPATDKSDLELGSWKRDWSLAVRRLDDGTAIGLARPQQEPPLILRWDDPRRPPRVLCKLADEPRPGYTTGFEVAPSGNACVALLARDEHHEVVWVDLKAATVKRIAVSSPLAYLPFDMRFAFAPERTRDRVAFEVDDLRALRGVGERVVIVYDGADGYVGEHPGAALDEWTPAGLRVRRAEIAGTSYTVRTLPFTSLASDALVQARLLGDAPGVAEREVRTRATQVQAARRAHVASDLVWPPNGGDADMAHGAEAAVAALELDATNRDAFRAAAHALEHLGDYARLRAAANRHVAADDGAGRGWIALAKAHHHLRDPAEALAAAERAVALAPFDDEAHLVHAAVLAARGAIDAAVAAGQQVLACNRERLADLANAPDLRPLWGHAGWRDVDYRRLLDARAYRDAIALIPDRDDAYRALVEAAPDAPETLAVTEQWRTCCPGSFDAWLMHAGARIDRGDKAAARRSIEELLARWPTEYIGYVMLARIVLEEEGEAAALAHLRRGEVVADQAGAAQRQELYEVVREDEALAPLADQIPEMVDSDRG